MKLQLTLEHDGGGEYFFGTLSDEGEVHTVLRINFVELSHTALRKILSEMEGGDIVGHA